jgi:uncharacterized membrane protein YeaQ/YmgE (transglycosylase-associated protein family)
MEVVIWLFVGLIGGWLAGITMRGSGYGLIGDIGVAGVGAVVAVWMFTLLVPDAQRGGYVGAIVVAVLGAAAFVGLARLLTRRTAPV